MRHRSCFYYRTAHYSHARYLVNPRGDNRVRTKRGVSEVKGVRATARVYVQQARTKMRMLSFPDLDVKY